MTKTLKLEGKNIYLRPLSMDDTNGPYPSWFNNPIVTRYNSHGGITYTKEMAKEYVQMTTSSEKYQVFAIIQNTTQQHIGNISLQQIDIKTKCADLAILIGETSVYGKGIGEESGNLLLAYAFNVLGLHRISCGTSSINIGMQKLALKLGMKQEGIRRDAFTKNGKFVDIIEYGILENEYK